MKNSFLLLMTKRNRKSLNNLCPKDSSTKSESNNLEFNLWLQEYQIVHNQIQNRLEADDKNYEFLIITLSVIIAATSIVISFKAYFLLLVLSIPFHILVWDQVRKSFIAHRLGKYVSEVVAPNLNASVNKYIASKPRFSEFIGWESYYSRTEYKWLVHTVRILPKFGRTLVEFGVSTLLLGIYFLVRDQDIQYIPTPFDFILVGLNAILIGVSLIVMLARLLQRKLIF